MIEAVRVELDVHTEWDGRFTIKFSLPASDPLTTALLAKHEALTLAAAIENPARDIFPRG